ncbi:hypothetical protein OG21DRAFT_1490725 [Imleria badia]|nr:hypothetical protein OG21DRAFT_1490725 [Imleria badia]
MISNAACKIVARFLEENSEDMQHLAAFLLEDLSFAYEDFESTCPDKAFQSFLLLDLLGPAHMQQTCGWVDISDLDLLSKYVHGVRGAIALCTAVLERTFKLAVDGRLEKIASIADEEDPIDKEISREVPSTGKWSNKQLPRILNKATRKESTKSIVFSHENWGGHTEAYYMSISNQRLDVIGDIIAGALYLLATSTDHFQLLEPASESSAAAISHDP